MDGQTVIYNSRVVFATETVSLFTSSEDIKPATITVTRLQRALETELAVGLGQLGDVLHQHGLVAGGHQGLRLPVLRLLHHLHGDGGYHGGPPGWWWGYQR